jgi:hypothetical protein
MQILFNGLCNGALIALPAMGVRWHLFAVGEKIADVYCCRNDAIFGDKMGRGGRMG